MRVTNGMVYRLMQTEINDINQRMLKLRQAAASGKKVNSPSDDPAGVRPILNYKTRIESCERYQKNMGTALNNMQILESHLDNIGDILVQVKQQTLHSINDALLPKDRENIADLIAQMKDELMGIANSKQNENYIFAGYKEDIQPFKLVESSPPIDDVSGKVVYNGDQHVKSIEIAPGERLKVGLNGQRLFMGKEDIDSDGELEQTGPNLFRALTNLEHSLRGLEEEVIDAKGNPLHQNEYFNADPDTQIPRLVDNNGDVVKDNNGNQIKLTDQNGDLIHLQKMRDENGEVVTLSDQWSPPLDYEGNPIAAEYWDKPVYVDQSGNPWDLLDQKGNPILEDSSGNAVITENGKTVNLSPNGEPMQFKVIHDSDGQLEALNKQIETLDEAMNRVWNIRGELGTSIQRLETAMDHRKDTENDLRQFLSLYEDTDIVEVSSQIVQQEIALKAALTVTSRISNLSILDYM